MPAPVEFRALMGADVALVAATTKTVLSILAGTGRVVVPTEIGIGLDDTIGTREAVLVEFCKWDNAGAGTGTTVTPERIRGPAVTLAATAKRTYTAEPTVLTPIKEWLIEPKSGLIVIQQPLGREAISDVAKGFAVRCTAPNAVNARGYISFEE